MITIFTLASGRSGTRFLCHLCRRNLRDAVCRHEPYFDWSNPSMFGRPIDDHQQGNLDPIRRLVERKQKGIGRHRCNVYVETNHAFLKSYYDISLDYFPNTKFIHLIRHPLKTARSETNRELILHRFRVPFRYYRGGDGKKYFRWSLTGKEPIYQGFDLDRLSLFQRYVIQWIEIENRAMQLLDRHATHDDCFTLHSPSDLNDPQRVQALFDYFQLDTIHEEVEIAGKKNRTPGTPTVITDQEQSQFRDVIAELPDSYLEIFRREPYTNFKWSALLKK